MTEERNAPSDFSLLGWSPLEAIGCAVLVGIASGLVTDGDRAVGIGAWCGALALRMIVRTSGGTHHAE